MTAKKDAAPPTWAFAYALGGTVLLAIAGLLFANLHESTEVFMVLTVVFAAPGAFLLIAGAVARGIEITRG
ncbi:hypothetical protein IEQ44_11355 [Nocardioides sp. Y6]|uniref:Uncharacterized protein n=1 Tax=Nocardioides malaquae TaxID=2773426 RepID=A0ABR9RUL8_9ACTN|nr:hypothetical protein [Nocardioides malaquae]MBE7325251.1 hypothetical protein [Nocardioides malaquae]